jgi:proline iminopeptidase
MIRVLALMLLCQFASPSCKAQDKSYEEWYLLTRDSVEIYVREIGNKIPRDTVIVIHGGFGANHDYMLDAIKGLERDYHLVLYDQRGSLLSPTPQSKLTFHDNVEDLKELIDELKVKKPKFLCHSTGTFVAMEFLKRYPEVAGRVVLVSALLPKATKYEDVFSKRVYEVAAGLEKRPEYLALVERYKRRENELSDKERTEYWRIQFANYNTFHVERWRFVKGGKAYYKGEAAVMGKANIWNYDYRPTLSRHGKVTFIQGNKDFLDMDAVLMTELLKNYSGITLEIIPDAGHLIWIDEPTAFLLAVKKALH